MPEPKTDRSAPPWKQTTLLERDPVAYFKLKHRNVDKQRRRLLGWLLWWGHDFDLPSNIDKQRRWLLADQCECHALAYVDLAGQGQRGEWYSAHAAKLRTIAARLRGMGWAGRSIVTVLGGRTTFSTSRHVGADE